MITTIFFDLDGTLLPMDQDKFLEGYFQTIINRFKNDDVKKILRAIDLGTRKMLVNDGKRTNEEAFWETFATFFPDLKTWEESFNEMYETDFQKLITYTNPSLVSQDVISVLKEKGYQLILSTNPLFPKIATYSRIRWANLDPDDFSHITTYENSSSSKPNLLYYQEIMDKFNLQPEEILLVGNDVDEDLCIKNLNIKTFLVTDNLLNKDNKEIITDYQGSLNDLLAFVKQMGSVGK